MSLLEFIERSLFDDISMTSEELENIFRQKGTIGSELFADMSPLVYIRSQCILILSYLRDSLDKLGLPNGTNITSIQEMCFQKPSLVFCTTSSSYKLKSIDFEPFNFLVIDEAAQVKESESIIALQIPDVRHAILVGDECQLPATVNSKLSEEAGFGRSLFERLSSLGHSKHLLNVQYRMHPSISRFPNSNFYQNQILDAPSLTNSGYERCYLQGRMFGPYSFINIRGGKEELDDVGHSRRNMVEVAVILKLVQKLFKAWNESKEKLTIGLVSPYAAQVAAIHEKIQHKYENIEGFIVKVKSIDGFQGGEEDIIIISTVRSNIGGSIGFLSSPHRTNVALTRARHCLWILGHERTLRKSDTVWEALICDARHRQCLFNADDDSDIRKTILDVKTELQDFEDLLRGESVLFQNSRWKVLFSDNFRKSFPKLKPPNVKKLVIHALHNVARGWRPKKINVELTCESCSYVVKQFKVEKYHVVCSTDIIKDSVYQQILKVWDILPMVETPKLLKRLDSIFSMYTDDFINHCNQKLLEGNLEVPKSWSISNDIIRFKNLNDNKASISVSSPCAVDSRNYVENSKVSESFLLMKFYTLSAGVVNHLLSDLKGREVDLPFEVSDEEREIIMFPKSSFILGRSGTGKTTILTTKLYRTLQQYCIADNGVHISNDDDSRLGALHQLFVTVSPKLCYAVKKHVSQLKSFASGNFSGNSNFAGMDDIDEMAEFKHIPDTFIGIQSEKYPLVITFHKFLMMLDGTLGNSYFERFRNTRYSSQREGGKRSVALQTFIRNNEVTYDRFRSLYWLHFNAKLTKNLYPSRVFTEIMSHIKGGQQEGNCKRSQLEYISLSKSRVSTLSPELREIIYYIFEDYEKMKIERGEFDIADFVMDIHFRLKKETLLGDKMDFVYIDEVQDLTMRQISLFRYICKNVEEGFVFSGDTAQTIARGIDFRFEDIRSLFYNKFVDDCEETSGRKRKEKGLISDLFCLSQNFRTHAGVLRLAQSVIDLICYFFPQSIDVLAPETSLIYGESPVLLEPGSNENSIVTIFGHSGKDGGKWVGFGADQVILVRDGSARKEICNYIGDQALVLTIVECKGLEFQDVLLYNFFGSSPMSNQWRVVYEFLKKKDLLDANCPKSFPSFSQSRHNIMCSELKQLYVAITRTRQRLWICENNEELSKPMFDLWKRLCLVQVRKLDDSLAEAMQRASNPEEWKNQGIKLFWEKNYEMATMCFEKAGDETWEKRSKASSLRAAADNLRCSNSEEAHIMLREAAEIFDSIGRADTAAECFCDLGEYERAGMIYLEKCGTTELKKAGECFCLAGSHKIAAEVYAKGNFFDECLSSCTKGNSFDLGLQYIENWKQQASRDREFRIRYKEINTISQEFLEKCAWECHRTKDNESFMKFVRAFPTIESKRNFLKNLDCLEELLVLEEESGYFIEAADIAKRLGDVVHEVDLLEKAGNLPNACLLILSYVLSSSLWMGGGQGWPVKSFPQKEQLLSKAVSLAEKVNSDFHASISSEAKILSHEEMKLSELMQCYIASKQDENRLCEILSVRKILYSHFKVNPANYDEWEPELNVDTRFYDERILRNRVSGGTLFYIWNLWKVQCLEILKCLESLQSVNFVRCEGIARFCLDYFGVGLPLGSSTSFLLMNPNAAWVRNVDERFLMKNRKIVTLESRHFVSAAEKYWHKELISSGLRVLETLKSLLKPFSKSGQSVCLICIFDEAKFFIDWKFPEIKEADFKKLNDFLQLSVKNFVRYKEMNTIAQEYLEKCAWECHRTKDNESFMKFVCAFPTIESKRNFLKNLDCLEELLVLEEESGNFIEAAEIAKRLGDVVLEIDLLEKAGNLPNASLLILSYVLSSSLWMGGGQGWPVKSFPQKEQLLSEAVSLAEKVNSTFHASISVEAKILSHEKMNLSGLMQCYIASKQHENRACEILCVRKILDSHFQVNLANYDEWEPELYVDMRFYGEKILRSRVSGGTLFYVWNLWKVQCLEILECLESLESVDVVRCEGIVRLCLDYFGVRLLHPHGLSTSFLLMNSKAAWVGNVDARFLMENWKIVTLESRHFVSAAKKYWHKELISSGLRVLETLKSLYKCLLMKPFSKSDQSVCLICTFDVAKFFIDLKSIEIKKSDFKKLNDFLQLSSKYFEIVFPLDPRHSLSENIIYLRETETSKNLLEEIISRNLLTRDDEPELTYGQIGRIVMIMMGSVNPMHDLFQKFAQLVCESSYWKCFIENINGIMLHKALEETYNVNYRMAKDYISPNCFFYLVERLLILVPHSKGFFFTTKSSFVEYVVSLRGDANATAGLVTEPSPARSTNFHSLVRIVEQCICDVQATADWIRMSHIDCNYYLPLLLQRLFVILCLLCLNSEHSFSVVSELLNLPHIKSELPREFGEAIQRIKNKNSAAVAAAFKVIGDPLVIVASSGNVGPMFDCPDAVFLDLGLFSCKNEVMKMLFPPIVKNVTKSSKATPTSDTDKLQINWSLIQEMSNTTELVRNSNDGNSKSLFLSKMVEVEEHLNFLTAALCKLEQTAEDNNVLCEIPSMIEELNQLCSSLEKSEFDFKGLWEIGEYLKRLEARRPQLDTLFIQKDTTNERVDSGGTDDNKISNSNCHTEDGKIEDSAVVANNLSKNAAQGSKGKGKKNSKKSRKGKGGRGK